MIDVVIIVMALAGAKKANLLAMRLTDCVRSSFVRVRGFVEPINADIAERAIDTKFIVLNTLLDSSGSENINN